MKLIHAIQQFRRLADGGEILDRKTGEVRSLSSARQRVILSNVRSAVAASAGVAKKDAELVELEPFAASLAEVGRAWAMERGKDEPRNVAANIRLFLSAVLGEYEETDRHGGANRRPVTRERVLPAWLPLFDVLERLAEAEPTKRTLPAMLVRFQDLCLRHGIRDPHAVPDDFDEVRGWVQEAQLEGSQFANMAAAFRTAREALGDSELPTFHQRVQHNARGIRSLPDIAQRLRAIGCEDESLTLPRRRWKQNAEYFLEG